MTFRPDPKPSARRRKPYAMKAQRLSDPWCLICGSLAQSTHHVIKRGQGGDDTRANLVSLCGTGTTGCHGLIERNDPEAKAALGRAIVERRPDVIEYVKAKRRHWRAWLERHLLISL